MQPVGHIAAKRLLAFEWIAMPVCDTYTAMFCQEAEDILLEVEGTVLALETQPRDQDIIDKLFRMAHTIKGSADMMGFDDIKTLTHHTETVLGELRSGKIAVTPELAGVILEWRDEVSAMVTAKITNSRIDSGVSTALIAKLKELQAGCRAPYTVQENAHACPAPLLNLAADPPAQAALPAVVPVETAAAPAPPEPAHAKPPAESEHKGKPIGGAGIKVSSEKLDCIVNLVGELVITQSQLMELASAENKPRLSAVAESINRLAGELRDIALSIRMMPVGATFSRFKRLVRDVSAGLGKQVDFATSGEDAELDKNIIDRLYEPLLHLVRNSIDHGIETPQERERGGKPAHGKITLSAEHTGGCVVITIADDGRGLDPERLRLHAEHKGLISGDSRLTDEEALELIFRPGFSTAEKVTDLSGRGVGMDVVRHEIEALGGSVKLSSAKGEGTVFRLVLPLTLAIIDGLQVRVGDNTFIISLKDVRECLELTEKSFALNKQNVVRVRDRLVPCVRLGRLLERRPGPDAGAVKNRTEEAVVILAGKKLLALIVDRVIGDCQTVIKPLGRMYKNVEFFSGSAIMGDGTVALILDTEGLCRRIETEEQGGRPAAAVAGL